MERSVLNIRNTAMAQNSQIMCENSEAIKYTLLQKLTHVERSLSRNKLFYSTFVCTVFIKTRGLVL